MLDFVPTIGSLCTGYGGLDLAVEYVFGARTIWYSEFEKHPSKLLETRLPGVPNLGDLTKIDWSTLDRPDILTAGYPCQPFSQAGKRQGEDDPRHLWPYIREAIRELRPRITILENVSGHRSKGFYQVLQDCAEDGLPVWWTSLRASDVGAPHHRDRLYFAISSDPESVGWPFAWREPEESGFGADGFEEPTSGLKVLPTPRASDANGSGKHGTGGPDLRTAMALLSPGVGTAVDWVEYEPLIRRWERVLGRPAPDPTEPNRNNRPRLTVAFDEWMMGLPEGWINDIDIPYGAKIKLCGNGVVPQQAVEAIRRLGAIASVSDWTLYDAAA